MSHFRLSAAATLALMLCACAAPLPPHDAAGGAPAQWQAPLPHNGSVADLSSWWRVQGDPLLAQLVESAQANSPTIASAATRIAQARAQRTAAGAALLPSLDAAASAVRSSQQSVMPMGTTTQAALQASWEIDLFGARRAERAAAAARVDGAHAGWHAARVSVAAETAKRYYALRACEQLLSVATRDAASRADTARLTDLSAAAGFQAPATAALARASAAQASARATEQRAQCDFDVKALVALTAIGEPDLRARLRSAPGTPPAPLAFNTIPAQLLAQRPDVFAAEREVAAASADVGSAQAQRYPRLALQGSVGVGNFRAGGSDTTADTWSIGPVALTVPVFDGGRRRANVEAARVRYDEAVSTYRATARQAVREVEETLVTLASTAARAADAQAALAGYRAAFVAAEDRYRNGLGSLIELEDARRTLLAAENAVIVLEQQRSSAWVGLYRAAGGGWNSATPGQQ
ncbi:efflux transporter outer membrane subunit [Pseudoduganella sp. GCM10020061]|uniref:efflux transporter outer membrane subunit n=1 Tax=Pseudoduganella sp. GCM10020061 TaxID=3317345 RepID=UPI00362AE214